MHNTTRKVVLQGCDGVAFIADSQIAETKNNNESFANLKANMKENRLDPNEIPIVIQFNKRDLPNVRTDDDLEAHRGARQGAGVSGHRRFRARACPRPSSAWRRRPGRRSRRRWDSARSTASRRKSSCGSLAKQLGRRSAAAEQLLGIGKGA